MKLKIKAGTTGRIVRVFAQDSSSSALAGLTGLAFGTAGLTAYYSRVGDAGATVINLVAATAGTWTSGGFKELDATNMPGLYELHLPNAALAAGSSAVHFELKGAANMAPVLGEIELDAVDYQSATAFVASVATVVDKAGYGLASTGLDAIAVTPATGQATTFPKMVVMLYRRFFARSTLTATQLKTYADDNTTALTTQTVSDDNTTQTVGTAS